MNSRERVRKAINHEEADRVPIDVGGTKVTSICIDAYVDLVKHLGLDLGLPKVYDQFGMSARMEEPVRKRLHSDVIQLENPSESWGLVNSDWKPWRTGVGNEVLMPGNFNPIVEADGYIHIRDEKGKGLAYMPKGGLYFERDCTTVMSDEIVYMKPREWKQSIPLYSDEHLEKLAKTAKFLHESTEYSVHGGFLKGSLGSNAIFAGHTISDWLCVLATDRDYAYSILRATAERVVENLEFYLQAVGDYIDTILISGTDFGTQRSTLFNADIFRDLYVPNYRLIMDYVHDHSHAKTMIHSCGSVVNLMDHFIDAGIDILNPIQTSAAGMDPFELKKRFGDRLVFWGGGTDTQMTLQTEPEEVVRDEVRVRIDAFAPGGGFVFASEHSIQYGVPPENIVAMADEAFEYGRYCK